ncbi:hypothetical protein Droror1_Dr00027906 [Drosera rotundifolia]
MLGISEFRGRCLGISYQTVDRNLGCISLLTWTLTQVSRHKRGIRNGPKALKPIPVIIRCKCCGKVRLPYFYCCGGRRDEADEKAG